MYIYNVTVNVDPSCKEAWLQWMKREHIQQVLDTGCFYEAKIFKLIEGGSAGETYCAQYRFREMKDLERYRQIFAPKLQKDGVDKFGEKALAFRTVLQQM